MKLEDVLLGNKWCDILRLWEEGSKDGKRGKKVGMLCMR